MLTELDIRFLTSVLVECIIYRGKVILPLKTFFCKELYTLKGSLIVSGCKILSGTVILRSSNNKPPTIKTNVWHVYYLEFALLKMNEVSCISMACGKITLNTAILSHQNTCMCVSWSAEQDGPSSDQST